jgi:hypothetical protein
MEHFAHACPAMCCTCVGEWHYFLHQQKDLQCFYGKFKLDVYEIRVAQDDVTWLNHVNKFKVMMVH